MTSFLQLTLITCYFSFSFTAPLKWLLAVYDELLEVIVEVTNQSSTTSDVNRTLSYSIAILDGLPFAVRLVSALPDVDNVYPYCSVLSDGSAACHVVQHCTAHPHGFSCPVRKCK